MKIEKQCQAVQKKKRPEKEQVSMQNANGGN